MTDSGIRDGGWLPARLAREVRLDLVETPALVKTLAWLASPLLHLVLVGGVGTGKTLAAARALDQHVRDGGGSGKARARYHTAGELLRVAPWSADLIDLEHASLLVVDEVGVDVDHRGRVESLLIARHEAGRRTIVVANMSVKQFRETMGERVADRIGSAGLVVACAGTSLRGKMAPKPRAHAAMPPPPMFAPPPTLDDLKASLGTGPLPVAPARDLTEDEVLARDAAQRALLDKQVEHLKRRRKAGEPTDT